MLQRCWAPPSPAIGRDLSRDHPGGQVGRIEPSDGTDEAAVAEGSLLPREQDAP